MEKEDILSGYSEWWLKYELGARSINTLCIPLNRYFLDYKEMMADYQDIYTVCRCCDP